MAGGAKRNAGMACPPFCDLHVTVIPMISLDSYSALGSLPRRVVATTAEKCMEVRHVALAVRDCGY